MRVLLDMNLSPEWLPHLREAGHEAVHWSHVGEQNAPDAVIMNWAHERDYVIITHDLDFGAILAATEARGPSVVQIRA